MIKQTTYVLFLLTFIGLNTVNVLGQTSFGPPSLQAKITEHTLSGDCNLSNPGLKGTGRDEFTKVDPPQWFTPGADRAATIVVSYSQGFPLEARPALEYALDIWGQLLNSQITIWVQANWGSLGAGVLAQAGPETVHSNFSGAPLSNRLYAGALANSLSVSDLSPGQPDIAITFGDVINWYYGLDGNTPSSKYDFVTVALHEVGHGLGFIGSASHNGTSGFIGLSGIPLIYDVFVETTDGTSILSYNSGTVSLGDALQSDGLFWNGVEGGAGSTIGRPRLYAPTNWNTGSSFSHLRESSYLSGSENSLMTPFLGTAEAIHDPGPVVKGMFADMGWDTQIVTCGILSAVSGLQLPCNPINSTYTQQVIVTYENNPTTGVIVVNGTSHAIGTSPQTITLVNQPADGLPVDVEVYFTSQPDCISTFPAAYTAIDPCCLDLRLVEVNPITKTISIRNTGNCGAVLDGFSFYSENLSTDLGTLLPIGSVVNSGDTVSLVWPEWTPEFNVVSKGELAIVNPVSQIIDYLQWGSANHSLELSASVDNVWTNNTFILGEPPFTYNGIGGFGLNEWLYTPYECTVVSATSGASSGCTAPLNLYTQDVDLVLLNAPVTGTINLNGQNFNLALLYPLLSFDGIAQVTLTLQNLLSNGLPVNLDVSFSDNATCSASFNTLFTAPITCFCTNDVNGDGVVNVGDLLDVLAEFGCTSNCIADVTGDGFVNVSDLLSILSEFGQVCV
ncbi:MAG: hypothetical protein COA49_03930 [Bacteroidetes bacterium]|nr:MAG: hypothetical protein COA49_03930 [Bacteroidota bacterium]